MQIKFTAEIWKYQGKAAWYFITLPKDESALIKHLNGTRRGFGSIRVTAQIGKSEWKTSVFPDSKLGAYLLPLKADVRKKEKLEEGIRVRVGLYFSDGF